MGEEMESNSGAGGWRVKKEQKGSFKLDSIDAFGTNVIIY